MDPSRKRKIRLVVALSAALVLATALVYTSINASDEDKTPSQLVASAQVGQTYQLTGQVVAGSVVHAGSRLKFRVEDPSGKGGATVPVAYTGAVPDPFREGRQIRVAVKKGADGAYDGQKDSLTTKCPSKFTTDPPKSAQKSVPKP